MNLCGGHLWNGPSGRQSFAVLTATVRERPCSLPLVLVDCNAAQQADSD